jgi:antitoxin VapB
MEGVSHYMALNVRNRETEKLASDLAALTGETKTEAVTKALKDRLEQIMRRRSKRDLADRLDEIAKHCAALLFWTVLRRRTTEYGARWFGETSRFARL